MYGPDGTGHHGRSRQRRQQGQERHPAPHHHPTDALRRMRELDQGKHPFRQRCQEDRDLGAPADCHHRLRQPQGYHGRLHRRFQQDRLRDKAQRRLLLPITPHAESDCGTIPQPLAHMARICTKSLLPPLRYLNAMISALIMAFTKST